MQLIFATFNVMHALLLFSKSGAHLKRSRFTIFCAPSPGFPVKPGKYDRKLSPTLLFESESLRSANETEAQQVSRAGQQTKVLRETTAGGTHARWMITISEVSMYVISNKVRFLGQIKPTITISPRQDDRQWRIRSK